MMITFSIEWGCDSQNYIALGPMPSLSTSNKQSARETFQEGPTFKSRKLKKTERYSLGEAMLSPL